MLLYNKLKCEVFIVKKLILSLIAILCLFGVVFAEKDENEYKPVDVVINMKSNLPAHIKVVEVLDKDKEVDFDEIDLPGGSYSYKLTYDEPEIHIYRFYQVPGENSKITYDDTEYFVHVEVEHNEDTDQLEGVAVAFKNEDAVDKVPELVWENEQPKPEVPTGDTTKIDIFETVGVVAAVLIVLLLALLFNDRKKEN